VLAPLGGRYNIELAKSIDQLRNASDLEREIERDQRVTDQGYHVIRLPVQEVLTKSEMLVERLQRIA
jgi:very-short-patch-repair endonuclease